MLKAPPTMAEQQPVIKSKQVSSERNVHYPVMTCPPAGTGEDGRGGAGGGYF